MPAVDNDTVFMDDNFGPVLVTVEYQVPPQEAREFLKAIRGYRDIDEFDDGTAREDGASSATRRTQIAMSKPLLFPHGGSTCGSTTA